MTHLSAELAQKRHVERSDYVSCTVAFIDCKKPGSHLKENYSIIGPGVSSSSDQVVNLPEPHGFNIGAAAMPNGITNNLHIHFTAEVFINFRGQWTFRWGSDGENEFVGNEGDILSVPTWIFRGFTNTGPDDGWLFTCLGGDNTGGVIFHPEIISEAAQYGLYISNKNMLIDTERGDVKPSENDLIAPMAAADVEKLRGWSPEQMRRRIVTEADRDFRPAFIDQALPGCGAELAPVIGAGITQNRDHTAPITNPHGFSMEWLRLAPRQKLSRFRIAEKMVLIARHGSVSLVLNETGDVKIALGAWDTYSVPSDVWREIQNGSDQTIEILLITSGDNRKQPEFAADVLAQAKTNGLALDAGGFVADAHLLPVYKFA
ncbi:quercetin dioxygenase-like cupin family protein [Paenochrobactrum gallinarii]|uniref:Quercetin dioxygenase-like cupin family protein n=1 Tax=Paenochrobactrum gallinarii TaxID=643673 RepID=A0A841M4E9_9HYPH|nr:hypothetical protein [Paenochrobactrum gallinarii]MBB6262639.1 quercetin dioxygenase-like cupin family protein [Paenochrobactrum gallinarii]